VVNHAKQKGASGDTVQTLEKLPSQNFGSASELIEKLPVGIISKSAYIV
jgi:hypothetical protein